MVDVGTYLHVLCTYPYIYSIYICDLKGSPKIVTIALVFQAFVGSEWTCIVLNLSQMSFQSWT